MEPATGTKQATSNQNNTMSRILDTRDLNKRKEELEALRDAVTEAEEALRDLEATGGGDATEGESQEEAILEAEGNLESAKEAFGDDEKEELAELENLESEISEWRHGEAMIPESEWIDYAQQLAEDIGAIPDNAQWPCTCIDWERAAKELAYDYSLVSYQGTDYYVRNC